MENYSRIEHVNSFENNELPVYKTSSISDCEAWLYSGLSFEKMFRRYDTLDDAVRQAIKEDGTSILCRGKYVEYGVINEATAYYVCDGRNIIVMINI